MLRAHRWALTFFCTTSCQLMLRKNLCSMTSLASLGPPPSLGRDGHQHPSPRAGSGRRASVQAGPSLQRGHPAQPFVILSQPQTTTWQGGEAKVQGGALMTTWTRWSHSLPHRVQQEGVGVVLGREPTHIWLGHRQLDGPRLGTRLPSPRNPHVPWKGREGQAWAWPWGSPAGASCVHHGLHRG